MMSTASLKGPAKNTQSASRQRKLNTGKVEEKPTRPVQEDISLNARGNNTKRHGKDRVVLVENEPKEVAISGRPTNYPIRPAQESISPNARDKEKTNRPTKRPGKENTNTPTVALVQNGPKEVEGPVSLPNQPAVPVATQIPKSSELCSAAVKWKSKLFVVDNESKRPQSQTDMLLERNDSSVASAGGESPRNHVTLNTESDEARASPSRKLSLGDFVTEVVPTTQEPLDKWEIMESSFSNGLVKSLPYIPVSLAYTCLLLNVVIPGSGTILAGLSMMCCGEPRGQAKPDELFNQFTTNIFVGVSQFFTVTFFLAGWIWSISWGIYLVHFAEAYKLKKAEERKRNKTAAIANTLWNR